MTKINVTHLPTSAAKLALVAFAAGSLASQPAFAQEDVTSNQPSVRDVAMTPLSDLNLSQDPIPDVLLRARAAPYSNRGIGECADILRAVGDLDAVLGDDLDTTPSDNRGFSATGVAQSVVGSFIPFRGVIRELSGAKSHEYDFREAITAGLMRRGFLKGRGLEMGCPYPASPATPELISRLRAASEADRQEAVEPAEETADDGTQFVSQPVVQGAQ